MDETVLPGIKENVVSDFYLTPDYFEKEMSTLHGSGFSIQPKFTQSAYFRFHNKSEIFDNLYFVGAGTHPGAGMQEYYFQLKYWMNYYNERKSKFNF